MTVNRGAGGMDAARSLFQPASFLSICLAR